LEDLKRKLDEIIDFSLIDNQKKWGKEDIALVENKYQLTLTADYIFYLQFYGNNYVKDNYLYKPTNSIYAITKEETYLTGAFFGLNEDAHNLEKEITARQNLLPNDIFPIVDIPGGDLVCMDKKNGSVYLWYHEMPEESCVYLVEESFTDFIMNIDFYEDRVDDNKIHHPKMIVSKELDSFLREASKKYRE
jgi:SMI1 / KNR4 family.